MSAIEKLFVQIFEKKKRIIDQAHRQCHLFDQHLVSKLLIDGIVPPPWLSNPVLPSLTSDPKDFNEALIFGALYSRAQSTVAFSDRHCSLQGNLVAKTDDGQPQSGLHSEFHAFKKDSSAGDGLSNVPDCSVNNVGCSSVSAPEMDSGDMSPQIPMESRISESYNDPALSLAKLQRSKSRQRALELRHSAMEAKSCSRDDNAGACTGRKSGSATSSRQLDHVEGSDVVKASDANVQSCAAEEIKSGGCFTRRNNRPNYSGRVTRSRNFAQKLNSSNVVSSSVVKEDGPESTNAIERLEPLNHPCFTNGNSQAKETDKGDYQRREIESNANRKRLTRSRSTKQAKCDNEFLKLESTLVGGNGVELQYSMQPLVAAIAAGRSSSSEKDRQLNTEIAMDSAEAAAAASSGNTGAVTTSTTEGSLRPVNSSNIDFRDSGHTNSTLNKNKSLLVKSLHAETVVAEKLLDTQEKIISSANVTNNIDDRAAGTVAKVAVEDVLVDKYDACLLSSPKVGLGISASWLPPSNFVMSVKPNLLDFEEFEESSMNGIPNADLKVVGQDVMPEKGPLTMLEPGCSDDKVTSPVCQENCNFSMDTQLLKRQEVTVREDGSHRKSFESHFEETDAARKAPNAVSSKSELFVVQKKLCPHTSIETEDLPLKPYSPMNHLIPSQAACQNSSGSFPKEAMAFKFVSDCIYAGSDENSSKILEDACSTAVTDNDLLGNTVKTVADLAFGSSSAAAMGESNISLTHLVPSAGTSLHENNNLARGKSFMDEKDAGSSRKFQIAKISTGSFASDMDHSCLQHKRRKIESQADRSLTASPNLLEKPHDSSNPRLVSGNLNIKEDNREAALGVQHLTSYQEDIENSYVSDSPAEEMQNTKGYHIMEESSLEGRLHQKFNSDGRDRSGNNLLTFTSKGLGESPGPCLPEQGSSVSHNCLTGRKVVTVSHGFDFGSTKRCIIDKKLDEEGSSSRRIYPGGTALLLEGSSVSQVTQRSDLAGTDETAPEIEGFIIQQEEARPCTDGDQIELEQLNFSSDTVEYASILENLGNSTFVHSPLCNSSNPYRLHKIPDFYRSLPNGLVEEMMGMRTSFSANGESGKSFSDCPPNCKDQSSWDIKKTYASPIQTLWDRINSKYGSSGKRESSKPELPCIDEENEAADEIASTFQNRIRPEGTSGSTTREPLAEITDNANPSLASQDDILADGRDLDSVAREFSFCGTNNQVKQKLENGSSGRRRFTGKGKENQSPFRGANRAKRATESLRNRSSRPKLSGKSSMTKGPTYSSGKSLCNNIVSNITSFIPLVQQKQAAEVITGKRDIKVKALEAAEAAKRMAEKKENERKMKKEALRLERERTEQNNLRQMELQNRKKEEERKKREAEMAAKKRQREEEERMEKERKRKRVEEARRKHQEHEKIRAKKEEKGTKCSAAVDGKIESKDSIDGRGKSKNLENNRQRNMEIPLAETSIKNPITDETKESKKHFDAVNDRGNTEKITGNTIKGTEDNDLIVIEEQSYDISPYKVSDDEEEDEDDTTDDNNKFVPSWASKHRLSLTISSQKLMDPETIFPLQSFCNIAEVLLPRKLQVK